MQPIHFIIFALAAALAYSLCRIGAKAIAKDRRYQFAQGKAAGRLEGRAELLSEHNALQLADLQTLLEISNTLHVAHKTWRLIPNTEKYRGKVTEHLNDLNQIATRIRDEAPPENTIVIEQENAA